jgi:hypothetical protein
MSRPAKEKTWNELTPAEVDNFYRLCSERAKLLADLATSLWLEFAKYLFAANTGAAAALFLLSGSDEQLWLLAFCLFCGGVFFVGVAFFAACSSARTLAEGWMSDFSALGRSEITIGELDTRHSMRCRSWKWQATRIGLVVSFLLLIAGGGVTAKAFWQAKPDPDQRINSAAQAKP